MDGNKERMVGMKVIPTEDKHVLRFGTRDMDVSSALLKALWGCSSPVLMVVQYFTIPMCCLISMHPDPLGGFPNKFPPLLQDKPCMSTSEEGWVQFLTGAVDHNMNKIKNFTQGQL